MFRILLHYLLVVTLIQQIVVLVIIDNFYSFIKSYSFIFERGDY